MNAAAESSTLLDPDVLSKIGDLDLLSLRVVDGFLSGKHRSTHKGGCFEFAEHRPYTPGDETRLIDWRVFAKSDRYYVKQFDEETNLQALMVIDASGSMQFGMKDVSKLDYARTACACLSRLLLRQRDAVGLALFDSQLRQFIPPRSNASHLQPILQALVRVSGGGDASMANDLHDVAKRLKRRGLIIIFSDFFGDLDRLSTALHRLRLRGHDVLVFHTMAPEERTFPFSRWSRFECLEVGGFHVDLDPTAVRKRYLERLDNFLRELQRVCAKTVCDYVPLSTDADLGDVLAHYLSRRTARFKR
jgi:uncharacterized protein (DUF58 family)